MTVTASPVSFLSTSVKRRLSLASLVISSFALIALLVQALTATMLAARAASDDGARVSLTSADVQTVVTSPCVPVAWTVEGAQAVALNGAIVEASGEGESCGGARPTLTVTFENGRSRDYRLPRSVVLDRSDVRLGLALVIVSALALAHYSGWFSGVYGRTGAWVRRHFPRMASDWVELKPLFRLNLSETSTAHQLAFIVILLVAFGVRLAYITMPMAIDEAMTYVNYVRLPIFEGLSNYSSTNNHLLHTLVAHLSVVLFGTQEWGVRLPAFIFGLLALPMTYVAGLRLYHRNAALLGMALVAASVLMIEYSVNARGYSIGTFIFLVQIVLAWYLRTHRNRLGYLLFGALSAISLGTIPTMLYAVATIEGWLFLSILLENRGRERWLLLREFFFAAVLTVALTALFYLGVMLVWGIRQIVANQFVVPQGFRSVAGALPGHIIEVVWLPWHEDLPTVLAWLLLAGFILGLLLHRRIGNTALPLGLMAMIVPPVIVIVQRVMPYVRSWQYAIPLYFVIASAALLYATLRLLRIRIDDAGRAVAGLAVVAAVGLTALVVADQSLPARVPLPEAAEITRALEPRLYTDDLVILDPSYRPLRYYFETFGLDRDSVRNRNPRNAPGIYLIVQPGQTVDGLLETMEIETTDYSAAALVEQFDEADLYYLTRTAASS